MVGGLFASLGLRITSVSCPRTFIVRADSDWKPLLGPSPRRGFPDVRRRRQLFSSLESLLATESFSRSASRAI